MQCTHTHAHAHAHAHAHTQYLPVGVPDDGCLVRTPSDYDTERLASCHTSNGTTVSTKVCGHTPSKAQPLHRKDMHMYVCTDEDIGTKFL